MRSLVKSLLLVGVLVAVLLVAAAPARADFYLRYQDGTFLQVHCEGGHDCIVIWIDAPGDLDIFGIAFNSASAWPVEIDLEGGHHGFAIWLNFLGNCSSSHCDYDLYGRSFSQGWFYVRRIRL